MAFKVSFHGTAPVSFLKPRSQNLGQLSGRCLLERNDRKVNFFSCGHITGGHHAVTPHFISQAGSCDLAMT